MYYHNKGKFEASILRQLKPFIDRGLISREQGLDIADDLWDQAKAVAFAAVDQWFAINGKSALNTIIQEVMGRHTG